MEQVYEVEGERLVQHYEKSWWRIAPIGYEGSVTCVYAGGWYLPEVVGHAWSITERGMKRALQRRVRAHRRRIEMEQASEVEIVGHGGGSLPPSSEGSAVRVGWDTYHTGDCQFTTDAGWECVDGCPTKEAVVREDYGALSRLYGPERLRPECFCGAEMKFTHLSEVLGVTDAHYWCPEGHLLNVAQ